MAIGIRVAALIGAIGSATALAQGDSAKEFPQPIDGGFRKLVLSEEFDSFDLGIDSSGDHRWYALRSLGSSVPASSFRVADGVLTLTTPPGDHYGTNASIATMPRLGNGRSLSFRFGYFEARVRFHPNLDNWPAFWLLNEIGLRRSKESDAHWCEIDIMEGINDRSYGGTVHDWRPGHSVQNRNALITTPASVRFDQWNTFGVSWTVETIKWFLNGKLMSTTPTPPICQTQKLSIILGAQKFRGGTAQTVDFDWVRVYQ